jgi:hypothetical protein
MTTMAPPPVSGKSVCFAPEVHGHGTSTGGPGCATLAEALSAAFQDATYYILQCGYPAPSISVSTVCRRCEGSGHLRIQRARSAKYRKCPDCKGKPTQEVIPSFVAQLHENCLCKGGAS